ncbi:MAG TPA: DNA replication/repair protein RecF [Firmicutes bacterium]|nr:DNA replication/repair protein RecF [Bacillota bacterium]
MLLERLRLRNFRNYASLDIELFPGKNVLLGNNGQGKTNIMEAIYLCGTGKSYRTSRDTDLIRWGESTFYTASRFLRKNGDLLVEVACSLERGKRIRLNGVHQDMGMEYIGAANVVIFGPDDLRIIKGGPVERRKFMDLEISAVHERYRKDLANYRRILTQRNTFLKDARHLVGSMHGKAALDVWDEQLVSVGARVMVKRAKVIDDLSVLAQNAYKEISSSGLLELTYRPSFDVVDSCPTDEQEMTQKWSALFRKELLRLRQAELMRGITLAGPHRDDITFTLDGVDMRAFSSQGQQRTAVLALRLAELEFIRNEMGEDAILLLDDVSSELDPSKRAHLWKYIDRGIQTVITTTDEKALDELSKPGKVFTVQSGSVQEVNK